MKLAFWIAIFVVGTVWDSWTSAFSIATRATTVAKRRGAVVPTTRLAAETTSAVSMVESYVQEQHAIFWNLVLSKNDALWKALRESASSNLSNNGITLFCPTNEAMKALGEARLRQLADDRNYETVLRMGEFHAVSEPVSADVLFNSAGVVSLARASRDQILAVERRKVGGFMGIGGTEDGTSTVGGAQIVQTICLGPSFIHATNGLVSPSILWRYCDQLRIPGT
jgi:Fasciclin domain